MPVPPFDHSSVLSEIDWSVNQTMAPGAGHPCGLVALNPCQSIGGHQCRQTVEKRKS